VTTIVDAGQDAHELVTSVTRVADSVCLYGEMVGLIVSVSVCVAVDTIALEFKHEVQVSITVWLALEVAAVLNTAEEDTPVTRFVDG